ncbi:MAG: S9 family peptidase [Gemmatimonadota bacterium]|nr:S9 family peptidase [Gemmatimonadota bacterium]
MFTHPPRRAAALLVSLIGSAAVLYAQPGDRAKALYAEIDRIFSERTYDAPRFGPARWLRDGTAYAIVERGPEGKGTQIIRYDAATGARTVLVAASRLIPSTDARTPSRQSREAGTGLDVEDYAWSQDGRTLLIFTNTRKVWRDNTRGDYWVLNVETGGLRQVGGGAPEASLMFAKLSPDGTQVAYVRANDIYVERLKDGRIVRLTTGGSATTINGTSDWVYEEELGLRDCFRWSPDGTRIAYWQFDTTRVGVFTLIDSTTGLYPALTRIPYPKVGTTNSAVRIGVVSAAGGPTKWMQTTGDPRNTYLARMDWLDPQTLAIQQLNRLQNRNDLLLARAATGAVTRVFRDESETWVEVVDDLLWIDDRRAFLWISERDGWQHLYRVPRTGADATLVTRFDADVTQVLGLDESQGLLYFLASPANATQRYLYRSRLDGAGSPERVTPTDQPGTHSYDVAPDGKLAFHTWSQFDRPPTTDVVELPGHRSLRALTDTSKLQTRLTGVLEPPVEFLTLDIGNNVVLDGWMLKPDTFDPARRYPVIVFVYGEPAGQTVLDRWGGGRRLFHRALADAGYVVVSFDNRGTPAPKGAAWRKIIYGTVGDLSSREQAAAIRALTARHAFLDGSRVGIWGWSGGGTNTLNAMFRFPELYRVGVSVAPVPDQRLYDTIYQERYMGLPQENVKGYQLGSAINFVEGLHGKLLIVHGSGDDNVHYQGTERLVNRLVELGKPFDMTVYPNRSHSISEGAGTSAHVYKLIARYFLEHLQ